MGAVHPLVADGSLVVTPGVYDALSAKLAERAGFPAVVLTGYGVSAALLGEPDLGLLTQSELLDVARRVRRAVSVGLVVDGDTGHGGPLNVRRLVGELVAMGANAVILEDQRWPKRCGHVADKQVVDAAEHAARIAAAVDERADAPFGIVARTDALATHGLDEAIARARLYREAGADVLFVEGPTSEEELATIGVELPGPLAVNLIEGGLTPILPVERLHELGFFSVGFVLSGLYAAARALETTYAAVRERASTAGLDVLDFGAFNALVGLPERLEEDRRYAT